MPNRRRFLTHESFARLVAIETDECVLWPHGVSSRGYGAISIENRTRAVHVLACEIAHGPKPSADMQVAHSCGVRQCMNSRHLRWATVAENAADRREHGTMLTGEAHPRFRRTEEVVAIVRDVVGDNLPISMAARAAGVSRATVRAILADEAQKKPRARWECRTVDVS